MSGSRMVTCAVASHTDVLSMRRRQSANGDGDGGVDGSCDGCDGACMVWWTVARGPDLRMECRTGFSTGSNNNGRARNLHTSQLPHDRCTVRRVPTHTQRERERAQAI